MGIILLLTACYKPRGPLAETIQQEIDNATEKGLDGAIICVHQPSATSLYAAGWHNKEDQIPAYPQALFKIASISKLYIAAAVAKLVSAETLSLDKTLAEYLPALADRIENAHDITLRMLVQHRSGIPNFTDHPDYPWTEPFEEASETYTLVNDMPADFSPDKKYAYSNTNYLLIGDILDTVLGYSHRKYIQENLVKPLGLENTYGLMADVEMEELMSGYFVGWEPDIKVNDFVQPGGSMVASAEDVAIFLQALNEGSLLSSEEQSIYASLCPFEHTGLLPGYCSIAKYQADLGAVVVLFVNTSSEEKWFAKGGKTWQQVDKLYKKIVKILSY